MVPKKPGEISARRAARVLEVHERTVRRWCRDHRLETGRRDGLTNRYYVQEEEVRRLKNRGGWSNEGNGG
jgi:predicted site-specific integrase-resolvase